MDEFDEIFNETLIKGLERLYLALVTIAAVILLADALICGG
jgi:hypothetical protein